MKRSKRLEQAIADWKIGAHHSGIMKLGWEYKKDGAELQEAIADAQAVYASIEDPHKHESHMREIVDAFEKVWETEYAASRPA